MAYQNPAFYPYHLLRDDAVVTTTTVPTQPNFPIFDERQGEVFAWETPMSDATDPQVRGAITASAESVLTDTIFISGHNWNGFDLAVVGYPITFGVDPVNLMPNYVILEANGVVIERDLTTQIDPMAHVLVTILDTTNPDPTRIPEVSEIWITTKLEMTRGPEPRWEHPWVRSQNRFVNDAGVTSTWLTGTARKRFSLTWDRVFGADRQTLFDLQRLSNDWSQPFWFRPPDTDYPTLLMELDRDGDWQQFLSNPAGSGTSDRVTLPLIQVLG